jgi:hypothetical protein
MKLLLTDSGIQNASIDAALTYAPTHHDCVHYFRQIRTAFQSPESSTSGPLTRRRTIACVSTTTL